MTGGLDVLNCGAGHISIDFDSGEEADVERAKNIIEDMLARGYTIVVETEDGETLKVKEFDPKTERYIIAEFPKKRGRPRGVPMRTSRGTGVGRTAGG